MDRRQVMRSVPDRNDAIRRRSTLPIFELAAPVTPHDSLAPLARGFFSVSLAAADAQQVTADTLRFRFPSGHADVNLETGGLWLASDALWRLPAVAEGGVDTLPSALPPRLRDQFSGMVLSLGQRAAGVQVRPDPAWADGARLVVWERQGWRRTTRYLDRTEGFRLKLDAPGHGLASVPIAGPGAALTRRTSPDGRSVGLHVAIPRLTGARLEVRALDRAGIDDVVLEALRQFESVRFAASLTYRAVQTTDGPYLCPFWTYEIVARLENRDVPIAAPSFPAVEIEQIVPGTRPETPLRPRAPSDGVDWGPETARPRFLLSWLGERAGRISFSRTIRDALVGSLTRDGWTCRDFGELQAAEAHWNRLAPGAIGQADMAGYAGHAAEYGMQFCPPDAAWLESRNCSFGGRLKWVLIDACGPLQDEVAGSGHSAFDHWAGSFCGMRAMLGFATAQQQNDSQFARALEYALAGQPLGRAWFQAACECQGPGTNHGRPAWAAGIFCVDGASTTMEDRLGDAGRLVQIDAPDTLAGVWVPLG
jgi:hypothetical protein